MTEINLENEKQFCNVKKSTEYKHLKEHSFKQGSQEWLNARKGVITSSKAATAIGFHGKSAVHTFN